MTTSYWRFMEEILERKQTKNREETNKQIK